MCIKRTAVNSVTRNNIGKMKRQYEAAKLSSAENYVASLSVYLTLLIDLVLMTTRTKAAFKT